MVRVVGRGSRQQVVVLDTVQDVGGVNKEEGGGGGGGQGRGGGRNVGDGGVTEGGSQGAVYWEILL